MYELEKQAPYEDKGLFGLASCLFVDFETNIFAAILTCYFFYVINYHISFLMISE